MVTAPTVPARLTPTLADVQSWARAWDEALYGAGGFYRGSAGPAGHFATATHGVPGRALARTLANLASELGADGVVDLGAGRGELLEALREVGFAGALTGCDVVERPTSLSPGIGWVRSPGGARLPGVEQVAQAGAVPLGRALVVAHEWLDVVPCTIAEVDPHGRLRTVEVDASSRERLGQEPVRAEQEWAHRWWPERDPGSRVEIGLARDEAWATMLERWRPLAAVAIDYGHTRESRPRHGTLTGYREGRAVPPVPDGSGDLTAHVAVDSLRQSTRLLGREAVRRWGPSSALPDPREASTDPSRYLQGLADAGATTSLTGHPFGDFWWVIAR
ncbi:SAM-dependent MidA family methyltransferase [Marihabitans asiaticum]|uniref:SAM-dependent MidA family methyltransferase n=1 Tax=Marihabitans asiaticum TaxID=415218 RepID=A0A560WDC5_9MICO|nr:SAM-dependent MidA family methyltransferase [Marihabitans asiaticum]